MPFAATWMDLGCHTERSQSAREGEVAYDLPYMQNLKSSDTNELTSRTERNSKT